MTATALFETGAPLSFSARAVNVHFRDTIALRDVSIDVPAGSCAALIGESGSGKTTLLRCVNRLVSPRTGDISIGGADVRSFDVAQLRRRVGYVPQHGGLLPHWRVLRNAALVPALLGNADAIEAARRAMSLVGLDPDRYGNRFPHELSGGQRQRVALARALAATPGVLLLDEPFGALDAITRADVQGAFERLRSDLPVTTLLVTHDLAEAARLADQIIVLKEGRVEQRGTFVDLMHAPETAYVEALVSRAISAASSLVPS
ncbi:MAG: ATP-binding cassette domain-containing protein [bacterium]